MMLVTDTSTQWLEISDTVNRQSWQQSQTISIPGNRFQAYLNQVCLETILPWLQEKSGIAPTIDSKNSLSFWEMVNGSAIVLGTTRLIFIPTESMDRNEFRVPQEWIDIPNFIGDYYFAVEVDSDEQCLHIWGYSTHEMLKSEGFYDETDRTYSLNGNQIIQDLTAFWVMQQLSGEETRTAISPLPALTSRQAEFLLQQLGDNLIALPRLEIPFVQWGALLEQNHLLEQLCQRRQSTVNATETTRQITRSTNLSQWWNNVFETGWQAIEDLFGTQPDLAFNFRGSDTTLTQVRRVKQIQLNAELPTLLLVIMLETEADGRMRIWVQILPQPGETYLPANLKLEQLSMTGDVLQSVQAGEMSNYIQLRRFKSLPGTEFRLKVASSDTFISEDFIV
ncbi:hypothetical protein NIES2119_21945 [[Phormidium ambiguum] IAM M-71]|uniref:DUF1822 domain-containing protein n=1 Tax=[Phormidium ambiguum] IAM M-71 TaxID=454136 RepID=A0A1U7IBJ1_9CYAN|nr:DUF1822 family protein [Phormidium ambiguum]OKH33955.1 hypothetical protein NIES2119_21945 [Phormidium ambiguum IAM M-71]